MSPIYHHPQQRRHRQQSMPPPMWQTLQLPSSQDLNKRQRASTMTDHHQPFPIVVTPSIHVMSPATHQPQPEEQEDYFTFISAQHNQPLFHIQPSSPPPTNIPEIRLDVAPSSSLLTPDATSRSIHSLAPPSVISDYDLFVSARQSFELNPSSATPSFHKHLADHALLLLESPSLLEALFPTVQDWKQKSLFSRLSALAALPLVFIFTVTLPVAEIDQIKVDDIQITEQDEEGTTHYASVPTAAAATTTASEHDMAVKVVVDDIDTKQGWNKQLLMLQCIISTAFILGVFAGR